MSDPIFHRLCCFLRQRLIWKQGNCCRIIFVTFLIITLAFGTFPVLALDIWVKPSSSSPASDIVLEGPITKGDTKKLIKVLYEVGPMAQSLILYSPGGDAYEAMKIGKLARKLLMPTKAPYVDFVFDASTNIDEPIEVCVKSSGRLYIVPARSNSNCMCASACALIWSAGVQRVNGVLRIHRPKISEQYFATLDASEAQELYGKMTNDIETYLQLYGFPNAGIDKMKSIPSYDIEKYIPPGMEGTAPYFDELLAAKCGTVPSKSIRWHGVLRTKIRQNRASEGENEEFSKLDKVVSALRNCRTGTEIFLRIKAFSEYFERDYLSEYRASGKASRK